MGTVCSPIQPPTSVGRSISKGITHYLERQFNDCNVIANNDILHVIEKYIGFIMDSSILTSDEQVHLHRLISECKLVMTNSIKHFDLLFKPKVNIADFDCYGLLRQCQGKENLIIVFHTDYDHVFCLYLKEKFGSASIFPVVLLLRSRFVYNDASKNPHLGDRSCPRIGKLKEEKRKKDTLLYTHFIPDDQFGQFICADLRITTGKRFRHQVTAKQALDFVGNELCGGEHFDSSPTNHNFRIQNVELFQLINY
eukprot:24550_1